MLKAEPLTAQQGGQDLSVLSKFLYLPGPNFMALLTVSTESALTEAGNYVLMASIFHGLATISSSARAYSALLGILRLQGKRRTLALARKRGIMTVSAEFGGKQSHEIGQRLYEIGP